VPTLFAVSDLHVLHPDNAARLAELRPDDDADWLIVAGDVGELAADVVRALAVLRERVARVVWTPGNHELWTHPSDPLQLRGEARYRYLVEACRALGVDTPEDPFPVWPHGPVPVLVAPLFLLYDYSFRAPGARSKAESLQRAYAAGVVCTDERLLSSEPYLSVDEWCRARVAWTRHRLDAMDPTLSTVLVNHWPLVRTPTRVLRYPEFAQWCGTDLTADWHLRYRALAVVYGHLHIPRLIHEDGVRMEEVSLGYPREWRHHLPQRRLLRQILPEPAVFDPAYPERPSVVAVTTTPSAAP
jgi:3',5'-cyclic AMP phosphodiesterase CpdA